MNYTHLTEDERYQIDDLKREGFKQNEIAELIGRSASTLSRELRRNKGDRGWRPGQAQRKAVDRLSIRGANNAGKISEAALAYALKHLQEDQWSPEEISGRLLHEGRKTISHETIYQRILEDKESGGTLHHHLRCKRKKKKRYGSAKSRRGSILHRVDIDQRPAIVESRKRVGDWEGDTIIGSHTRGAVIASVVERKSRYTVLAKAKNKTAVAVTESINKKMLPIAELTHTITLDNGKEFSLHQTLACVLEAKIYFAKPYHSWERGLNENTNGLVRQYFPKKMSFDNITEQELKNVENKLNHRPRKCLGYMTPYEVFSKSCDKLGIALRI